MYAKRLNYHKQNNIVMIPNVSVRSGGGCDLVLDIPDGNRRVASCSGISSLRRNGSCGAVGKCAL